MRKWEVAATMVGVGWYISICIILGVFGGRWLDSKFNTEPTLLIIGLVLGIFIAFYGVYRMILPNLENKRNNKGEG